MIRSGKMSQVKLSQEEAEHLINMLKYTLTPMISFPTKGNTEEFHVVGNKKQDDFAIHIFRGKIDSFKYNIGARISKNGILLLELHISPSNVHRNPDGEKITGSHWHIYSEKYGRSQAFPAENLDSKKFVENTMLFFKKFHVVECPNVNLQLEFE